MFNNRNILLYPVSLIYGLVTGIRNFLYSAGIIKSYSFDLPVICIGNITIGGTGKTPHTEYVTGLLKENYKVAVLSRGYKRKTRGFIIASPGSTAHDIGDEPLQIYSRFPGITVAVDSNRVRGLKRILEERPETDVVILDDGFQHRRLTPGFSILLSDYNRPMAKDHLIPFGSLREHRRNSARADVLIITKSPEDITPIDRRLITDRTEKYPYQTLLFSSLKYGQPLPVYNDNSSEFRLEWNSFQDNGALLITGIASPEPLVSYVKRFFSEVHHLRFPDHHDFTENDLSRTVEAWKVLNKPHKYIITTEKDAVRLREFTNIADDLKNAFFFIPVSVSFLNNGRDDFDKMVTSYVGKNNRNKRLPG